MAFFGICFYIYNLRFLYVVEYIILNTTTYEGLNCCFIEYILFQ